MSTHNKSRAERNSWRTSTAPAAVSVALLAGLAVALAIGLHKLIDVVVTMFGL